ncbi:MAG: pre-peptidase C-terminal domain-containing protein [Phycisphaerales bacterium]|nr:pre-peptidase C-terminal domain-containing protein [Phycisphaerales bacterium]
MNKTMKATLSAGALLGLAGAANADFAGQTILGPLGPGSSVGGDTSTSTDDNNGFTTGTPGGSWSGADDVYQLNWPGGSITVDLLFTHASGDLDLFLWDSDQNTNIVASTSTSDNEGFFGTLAAGTYYMTVDGWAGDSNSYTLNVVPTPAAAGVLGMAGLAGITRRRRA